ncbi:hypothetical protein [Polymorphospora rubra]|uniref:hypothetical protein n=1 Tax=Polymorphospora rubra TaxID=338584 RepID=UPI0033D39952
MFLVVVSVETPNGQVAASHLHQVLRDSSAGVDRLQHAHLEVREDAAVFSLFLQTDDRSAAVRQAHQLCRRTMAAVAPDTAWRMRSTEVL